MVKREPSEVFHFNIVALKIWSRCRRVTAVARCSGAENTRVGNGRVVEPDDDALPVVAVATHDVTRDWLVFGPVPCIHDSELASMPSCSSVGLALVGVATSSADITTVVEASTVKNMCEFLKFKWI